MTPNNILSTPYPFLFNKYSLWYFNIIKKAKQENRKKKCGVYYESHHILPRSVGGDNSKENLILLTAREHFICHFLLIKFIDRKFKKSMILAFSKMKSQNKNQNRYFNSTLYSKIREELSIILSERAKNKYDGNKNPMYGKNVLDVWIKKYGEEEAKIKWKDKARRQKEKVAGKKRTKEFCELISSIHKGKKKKQEHIDKYLKGDNNPMSKKNRPQGGSLLGRSAFYETISRKKRYLIEDDENTIRMLNDKIIIRWKDL